MTNSDRTPEQQKRDKARIRAIANRGGPRTKNEAMVYKALRRRYAATADAVFPR